MRSHSIPAIIEGGWTPARPGRAVSQTAPPGERFAEFDRRDLAARADRSAFGGPLRPLRRRGGEELLCCGSAHRRCWPRSWHQETLLAVWRKGARVRRRQVRTLDLDIRHRPEPAWIDAARRERRRAGRRRSHRRAGPEPPPDARARRAAVRGRIRHALGKLPPEQAEVVRLSFFSDKPHAQIAAELDLPLGTVKSRLRLAMARLRELLPETWHDRADPSPLRRPDRRLRPRRAGRGPRAGAAGPLRSLSRVPRLAGPRRGRRRRHCWPRSSRPRW